MKTRFSAVRAGASLLSTALPVALLLSIAGAPTVSPIREQVDAGGPGGRVVTTSTAASSAASATPSASKVNRQALTGTNVEPSARGLSAADAAQARSHANDRAVGVSLASTPVDLPRLGVSGVTWPAGSGAGISVQYRTEVAGAWSDWTFVASEPDHAPDAAEAKAAAKRTGGPREGTDPIITTNAQRIQVRVIAPQGAASPKAQLAVVTPGTAAGTTSGAAAGNVEPVAYTTSATTASAATVVPQPTIYTRAQWGADETLRDQTPPDYGVVDAAFVHHTAGTNSYAEGDVPGIIRGIYAYHVQVNGWRDIGYNFLVDKFGRTWEGRFGGMDKAVVGAHTLGLNSYTFGVSVLGNYNDVKPTSATLTALTNLIAWKADLHRFDAAGTTIINGTTYNTISGHRDAKNNSTECPGTYLYAQLPYLRAAVAAKSPSATRLAGSDRYSTAAAVSAFTFAPGVPVAYVATGANFPDALAAGPAGGHLGGPVLLTAADSLPSSTQTELQRLKPGRIVVLGGVATVSDAVVSRLTTLAPTVTRIAGADRYATAAAVAASAFGTNVPVAYVATGADFPDALASGPAGGAQGGPLLLTETNSLPQPTIDALKRLNPAAIVVLGGAAIVSDTVLSQLRSYSASVTRAAGPDRYATAARTSAGAFSPGVPIVFVATGENFPDALAAGPAGGQRGGPVLLTATTSLPQSTIDELFRLAPAKVVVLGGAGAVSTAVAMRLYNYEVPPAG